MSHLTDAEKKQLCTLIQEGKPLPAVYKSKLFGPEDGTVQATKEYRLVYEGKLKREEVPAKTLAAPWQLVRRFCTERPHPDGWHNLLVWGDNLLALRGLLADQQGPNRFGTRGKIKLIYIDPPFATRQDFMKDKEKAYRDKVLGSLFTPLISAPRKDNRPGPERVEDWSRQTGEPSDGMRTGTGPVVSHEVMQIGDDDAKRP